MIPDFPYNIRLRLARLKFFLLHPDIAKSLPCWLSQFNFSCLAETANREETEQCQDPTKKINQANLNFIIRGKSGVIKFEFKTN